MSRFDVYSADKQRVLRLYERECTVCGTRDAIDVAHLFEDATFLRAGAARLLLLCPTHNQAEERAHGASAPPLPASFNPESLITDARSEYKLGRYQQAYPKARLAAYLYEKKGYYSEAVDALNEAISAARPVRWEDFLSASVLEVERLCLHHQIGLAVRWLFLDRFSLVLYDYSRWTEALEVMSAAETLLRRSPRNDYSPERLEFDKDVSFRRHALITACNNAFSRGETLSTLIERLVGDAKNFRSSGHFDEWAKNLGMARRLTREMAGNPAKAQGYVEIVLEKEEKVTHKWELLEQKVSAANYFHSTSDQKKAFEHISQALEAYSQHPLLLEPVLESKGPTQYDIHDHVSHLGISYPTLIERGVRIHPRIHEVSLQLRSGEIVRVVKSLIGH